MKTRWVQFRDRDLPFEGKHDWVVVAVYLVKPDRGKVYQLSQEALRSTQGPRCVHCGEKWTEQLSHKPCAGG